MSDQVTEQSDVQDDAEALASAMAGYNKKEARGEMPPAEPVEQPVQADTEAGAEAPVAEAEPTTEPEPPQEPTVTDLAEELKALKAKVAASTSDPDAVRKLHGEIGNINRTLKQMQSSAPKKEEAPVVDEMAAALQIAEKTAEEYPEIAGPLVKAIKAVTTWKQTAPEVQPKEIEDRVSAAQARQREAIEALAEEHPDYTTVRETPEFKAWLSSRTPEYQDKLNSTWNPAVVSRGLTEFKDSLKTKQKKQDRLAAAVVTPAASQQAKPSTLPDEQGLWVGYNKGPKRLTNR